MALPPSNAALIAKALRVTATSDPADTLATGDAWSVVLEALADVTDQVGAALFERNIGTGVTAQIRADYDAWVDRLLEYGDRINELPKDSPIDVWEAVTVPLLIPADKTPDLDSPFRLLLQVGVVVDQRAEFNAQFWKDLAQGAREAQEKARSAAFELGIRISPALGLLALGEEAAKQLPKVGRALLWVAGGIVGVGLLAFAIWATVKQKKAIEAEA